jgi:glyoxylase-like metal-dependent hydrolase (beta-lactamase superfamily II)
LIRVEQIKSLGDNFSYIVWDEAGPDAFAIDPGFNADEVISRAKAKGLKVRIVFATHHHMDHSAGLSLLKEAFGAEVAAYRLSPLEKNRMLEDGEAIRSGRLTARIIHTPGHTEDGICILINGAVFTGDTLFVGECGRTDLPGGSSIALYESLFGKLLKLGDSTIVYPGHNYGDRPHSTIGEEKRTNYTLKKRTLDEFVAFMKEP